ncbi:MAG: sulfatase-like hydrolase/transferase, partial [Gemmatimonadota bacterium]
RVPTPNIDRLAHEGLRFTDFYVSSPICSPSRVGLTTGMYPSRWGIHSFLASRARNVERGMPNWLDPRAPTLPRALQAAGYATGQFGKWHMGGGRDVGDAPLITAYGFDTSVTSFEGLGPRYLWPDGLNEQSAALGRGWIEWTEKHRMTRHYVDHAIDFMRRHRDGPFYINLWPNDVHDEHLPAPGRADAFRDVARSDYEARFFAVLDELDRQLGRLLGELERLGLEDRTLVLFTGDNGPTDWPYYYDEGVQPPGSTGGFRGRKWSLYEGGIRQPLLVRWPGRVPAGVVDDETIIAATDLVPTLAAIAGADLPRDSLDGENLGSALQGTPVRRREPLFWYYPNDLEPGDPASLTPPLAIRDGRWKLLVRRDGGGAQLYDLEADPGETTDLASRRPEVVDRLRSRVLRWSSTLPLPARAGEPERAGP